MSRKIRILRDESDSLLQWIGRHKWWNSIPEWNRCCWWLAIVNNVWNVSRSSLWWISYKTAILYIEINGHIKNSVKTITAIDLSLRHIIDLTNSNSNRRKSSEKHKHGHFALCSSIRRKYARVTRNYVLCV